MYLKIKPRYGLGVNITDAPSSMTYASAVSRDSVRTVSLISDLNDLGILAGNIQNTYLNAPTKEKVLFYTGDELKSDQWKLVLIGRALYGLKSSSIICRNNLSYILGNYLGFKSSLSDQNVWYKDSICKDGFK